MKLSTYVRRLLQKFQSSIQRNATSRAQYSVMEGHELPCKARTRTGSIYSCKFSVLQALKHDGRAALHATIPPLGRKGHTKRLSSKN